MRFQKILLILAMICLIAACGDQSGDTASAAGGDTAADTAGTVTADAGGSIGPDTMPDREADPLSFLYYRIDRMFEETDTDGDGNLSLEEYQGEVYNFERIDMNSDGLISKQEIVEDRLPALREAGKIP